jgi:hypothetical protein
VSRGGAVTGPVGLTRPGYGGALAIAADQGTLTVSDAGPLEPPTAEPG